jgi:predicted DNA binding protein
MLFAKNKKITNVSIAQIHPELTDKQKAAIKLAIEEGYYKIPREIDVKDLAKKSRLAFSTFQNHLRKAESKLIPYSFSKI